MFTSHTLVIRRHTLQALSSILDKQYVLLSQCCHMVMLCCILFSLFNSFFSLSSKVVKKTVDAEQLLGPQSEHHKGSEKLCVTHSNSFSLTRIIIGMIVIFYPMLSNFRNCFPMFSSLLPFVLLVRISVAVRK